mmetsp:Transcript_71395/g.225594  ORF Transcript_71395/g.225594 Transcript_71395/m.225594 type:complete len:245 (+) Transcript_71395:2351-3085(+)
MPSRMFPHGHPTPALPSHEGRYLCEGQGFSAGRAAQPARRARGPPVRPQGQEAPVSAACSERGGRRPPAAAISARQPRPGPLMKRSPLCHPTSLRLLASVPAPGPHRQSRCCRAPTSPMLPAWAGWRKRVQRGSEFETYRPPRRRDPTAPDVSAAAAPSARQQDVARRANHPEVETRLPQMCLRPVLQPPLAAARPVQEQPPLQQVPPCRSRPLKSCRSRAPSTPHPWRCLRRPWRPWGHEPQA